MRVDCVVSMTVPCVVSFDCITILFLKFTADVRDLVGLYEYYIENNGKYFEHVLLVSVLFILVHTIP